ncbi:unnamed protein product [Allacma fusca]|uniref:Uncharacterized protein n=1 Tax=Allacma fusca TaxID=39272 RepID=A0A8J2KVS1_9HEXA|nr:unnamed protein product [Allacma fusca]
MGDISIISPTLPQTNGRRGFQQSEDKLRMKLKGSPQSNSGNLFVKIVQYQYTKMTLVKLLLLSAVVVASALSGTNGDPFPNSNDGISHPNKDNMQAEPLSRHARHIPTGYLSAVWASGNSHNNFHHQRPYNAHYRNPVAERRQQNSGHGNRKKGIYFRG